jgi:hypothetical protein
LGLYLVSCSDVLGGGDGGVIYAEQMVMMGSKTALTRRDVRLYVFSFF